MAIGLRLCCYVCMMSVVSDTEEARGKIGDIMSNVSVLLVRA